METIGFLYAAIAHEYEQTNSQEPLPASRSRGVGLRRIGLAMGAIAFSLLSVVPAARAAIEHGTVSSAVTQIQQALKQAGLFWVRTDGVFGSETRDAVKLFQTFQGLPADGVVGGQTAARLNLCGVEYSNPCSAANPQPGPVQTPLPQPSPDNRSVSNWQPIPPVPDIAPVPGIPTPAPNPGMPTPGTPSSGILVVATSAGRLYGLAGPGMNYSIREIYANGMRLSITGRRMNGWIELTNGLWVDGGGVVSPYDVIPPAPGNSGGGAGDPFIPTWPQTPDPQAQVPQMPNPQIPNPQASTAPYPYFTPDPLPAPQPFPGWVGTGNTVVVVTPGNDLNGRVGPGIEYAIASIYTNGTRLPTTGYTDRGWVQLSNGLWVAGNYVRSVP